MTKFLFCNFPYYGHVNPTLPLVQELITRGAEVIYYCSNEFKDAIQSTGATFRPYRDAGDEDTGFGMESHLIFRSHYIIQQVLEDARGQGADYLIYDSQCLWAKLLSDILSIPAIRSFTTYPLNERFRPFNFYAPKHPMPQDLAAREHQSIDIFCNIYNLPHFGHHTVFFHVEPLNIVFLPKELHPAGELFDERFKFVGPSIAHHEETTAFPLDQLGGRPILYVSLGTVNSDFALFYDICIHAFGNQPQQLILSIGDKIDPELYGPLPDNVMMYRRVPQLSILQRADIFITHGGMNSVMEAFYCGIPLVVIPITREQRITAQRVEELKLGMTIKDARLITTFTLRNIVAQVAENVEFRTNVQRMRDTMLKAEGHKEAADAILQLARAKHQ